MATYKKLLKNRAGDTIIPVTEPLQVETVAMPDFISIASGMNITSGHVYTIGNLVFGDLVIHKTSGTFGTSQSTVGTVKEAYRPASSLNSYGAICAEEWGASDVCYFYIHTTGAMYVADKNSTGRAWAKATFAYRIN